MVRVGVLVRFTRYAHNYLFRFGRRRKAGRSHIALPLDALRMTSSNVLYLRVAGTRRNFAAEPIGDLPFPVDGSAPGVLTLERVGANPWILIWTLGRFRVDDDDDDGGCGGAPALWRGRGILDDDGRASLVEIPSSPVDEEAAWHQEPVAHPTEWGSGVTFDRSQLEAFVAWRECWEPAHEIGLSPVSDQGWHPGAQDPIFSALCMDRLP